MSHNAEIPNCWQRLTKTKIFALSSRFDGLSKQSGFFMQVFLLHNALISQIQLHKRGHVGVTCEGSDQRLYTSCNLPCSPAFIPATSDCRGHVFAASQSRAMVPNHKAGFDHVRPGAERNSQAKCRAKADQRGALLGGEFFLFRHAPLELIRRQADDVFVLVGVEIVGGRVEVLEFDAPLKHNRPSTPRARDGGHGIPA